MLAGAIGNNIIYCFDHPDDELRKWSNKGIIKCPSCNKPYEYCHGKIMEPYFRHKDKEECNYLYSEAETKEHYEGKKKIYQWLVNQDNVTDVILEGWIPETKQRPDLMFTYNKKQCVIEYQCSPISSEYLERHDLYRAAGISDVWVCGVQNYFQYYHDGDGRKRMSTLEKNTNLYYDPGCNLIFKICRDISDRDYYRIRWKQTYAHTMENIYDYVPGVENFYIAKDNVVVKCYSLSSLKLKEVS